MRSSIRSISLRSGPALGLVTVAAVLAACTDATSAPRLTPIDRPSAATASVGSCTASPVTAMRVTRDTITFASTEPSSAASVQVTACTQFGGEFSVAITANGVATVSPTGTITPIRPSDGSPAYRVLTITAAANAQPGANADTITITDRKGNVARIVATAIAGPLTLTPDQLVLPSPSSSGGAGAGKALVAFGSQPGYAGPLTIVGCASSTPGCTAIPPSASMTSAYQCTLGGGTIVVAALKSAQAVAVSASGVTSGSGSCTFNIRGALGTAPVPLVVQAPN